MGLDAGILQVSKVKYGEFLEQFDSNAPRLRYVHPCNEDRTSKLIRQPCACVTRSWSIGHRLLREPASSGAYAVC